MDGWIIGWVGCVVSLMANSNGASFESMANGIFSSLNQAEVEKAALHGNDLDQQTVYAHQDIARQLRLLGVLESSKEGADATGTPSTVVIGAHPKTTLFALIRAFDFARIDGYEVECTELADGVYLLGWCGGDDAADFNDQHWNLWKAATNSTSLIPKVSSSQSSSSARAPT